MLNIIVLPSREIGVCLLDPWRERGWESVMGRHPAAPHFTGVRLRGERTNPMNQTYPMKLPGSPKPLKGKCGAKLIKSKKKYGKIRYCTAFPVRGRTRCRSHGGLTPQGIASPHYRGKGYSQSVPKHLKDIYEAHFDDPEPLSLYKEIALCNTRIEDLLTQISGRSGDCIEQVSAAFLAFQKAFKADELAGELDDLEKAIRRLKRDRSTWQEIREEKKNKARLVGTAQRVEFAEGRGVTMGPHVFLQEFQTAYSRRLGLDSAKVVE